MKKNIHPKYYPKAEATCTCGATFIVGATKPKIEVEVCSKCHPLYTGSKKIIDARGQVEKFQKRIEKSKKLQSKIQSKSSKVKNQKEKKSKTTSKKK
ncbi:MAG: 50S ribosomal protein L31 [Candidatus Pacebacteria bacterium]|nr:50S ribosomal protein L31 [Candidatus Paceibacterota bacterium]